MKKIFSVIILLGAIGINCVLAQDSLLIHKNGAIVNKIAVTDIDSITFKLDPKANITDIDGNIYTSVIIGTQTWLVENLKTKHFNNGDLIPTMAGSNSNATQPYQWVMYDESYANVYGRLYSWAVTTDPRGVAPTGYRVASDADWTTLQKYLESNGYNYDGSKSGNLYAKSICSKTTWTSSSVTGSVGNDLTKNNTTGLSILPGGYRGYDGSFYIMNEGTDIWTSTEGNSTQAIIRAIGYNGASVNTHTLNKTYGFSIRCIKN